MDKKQIIYFSIPMVLILFSIPFFTLTAEPINTQEDLKLTATDIIGIGSTIIFIIGSPIGILFSRKIRSAIEINQWQRISMSLLWTAIILVWLFLVGLYISIQINPVVLNK